MKQVERVVIIGAGLSGLTLAYELEKKGIYSLVLEASDRIGGRVQTEKGVNGTPLELGATWFADKHITLMSLIRELSLQTFKQFSAGVSIFQTRSFEPPQKFYTPESEYPSYRIAGGTQVITNTLAAKLKRSTIIKGCKVVKLEEVAAGIAVHTASKDVYEAERVCIAIPPALAGASIEFPKDISPYVRGTLPTVHTWMAGSIKFVLEYETPFWRNNGLSGSLFSHAGIIVEMYDHTNFEENRFGFTGFLNPGAAAYNIYKRKELVLRQLVELFGEDFVEPVFYLDKVWDNEFIVSGKQVIETPHQNNGHPVFQIGHLKNKLFFCGTETVNHFGGYMEGAVYAALKTAEKINPGSFVY
jgi:monoamine oxidase